jgi:3-hydroxybutyryl-CoA dehydrogenase
MSEIKVVGVLGCGMMGRGIAQVCAQAGYETVVMDVSQQLIDQGLAGMEGQLARLVQKEAITGEERDGVMQRIQGTTVVEDLADCDLLIEAVIEDLDIKNRMWRVLDSACAPEAIFASNTSSLTISAMAACTTRPERMIGLHFFNPVPVMRLVEVVRTIATDQSVLDAAFRFVRSLDKEPIACKDSSGFVVNLLLVPYMMDAIRALEHGVASTEDIDKAMKLGTGHPMGPFTLCDFVGLDTLDRIGDIMFDEYREQRYASPPLLKRMVSLGFFGRKSGRGFYDYSEEPPVVIDLGI